MTTINLTPAESKLLTAVIMEMNKMPEVDYEAVGKKVGIKYARIAKTSFKKVWDKLKAGSAAASGVDDEDEVEDDMAVKSSSPKKPAAKKSPPPKKAPAVKKGVAKATGPKKVTEGGPKVKAPARKTKKQKEEEDVAAEAGNPEDIKDEDLEEGNEDGKSLPVIAPADQTSSNKLVSTAPGKSETVQSTESFHSNDAATAESTIETVEIPMNDEYEAYIRQMEISDWLAWKAQVGYTFNHI